jgi:hypothetical protein
LDQLSRLLGLRRRFRLRLRLRLRLPDGLLRHDRRRGLRIRRSRVLRLGRQGWKDNMLNDFAADRADDIHRAGNTRLGRNAISLHEILVHDFAGIGMDTGEGGDSQENEKGKEEE